MSNTPIAFSEVEVARILWVLTEATELAEQVDALSTLAHIEEILKLVRDRFDRHRPTDS